MKNQKNKVWTITAGIIFALVMIATAILFIKIAQLSMLPTKYFGLVVLAVGVLLLFIFILFFLLPKKKALFKYLLRTIALILAFLLLFMDIAGIQVVSKFGNMISNIVEDETEQKEEEKLFVGVYVRMDDVAKSLDDVKHYHMGYSLSYDNDNTIRAIHEIENQIQRSLDLEEYENVVSMVDALLKEEKDAFVLSSGYLSILETQEEYTEISDKIRCIYECYLTPEVTEIDTQDETDSKKDTVAFDITKKPFIVYIGGTDTRGNGLKKVRNDVNILAVVNPVTKQVLLINTPRDYYVKISVSSTGKRDKLTHCGIYGIRCSMRTLENLYGETIRYYTHINFKGFTRLIDAIGGVTIYSSKELGHAGGAYHIKVGENTLNGEQALAYARDRHSYAEGDIARGRHQMDIVKGVINKLASGTIITQYADILDIMGQYFDCNISESNISALVKMQLTDMAAWDVKTFTVTGKGEKRTTYSMPTLKSYVMMPNEKDVKHAQYLIDKVFKGEPIQEEDLKVPAE